MSVFIGQTDRQTEREKESKSQWKKQMTAIPYFWDLIVIIDLMYLVTVAVSIEMFDWAMVAGICKDVFKTVHHFECFKTFSQLVFKLQIEINVCKLFKKWVTLCLCFKMSLCAKIFIFAWVWFIWKWTCSWNAFQYEWFGFCFSEILFFSFHSRAFDDFFWCWGANQWCRAFVSVATITGNDKEIWFLSIHSRDIHVNSPSSTLFMPSQDIVLQGAGEQ